MKVVILVGGPSKGTRFRPLSLDVAKPLFPVAGQPLIYHHLEACKNLEGLTEVLLIGFYDNQAPEWRTFLADAQQQLGLKVSYLLEDARLGTAGGLKHFKKEILAGNPDHVLLMHCDIVCTFPLTEMLNFHKQHGKECTILGKKVPKEEAGKYGCLVIDPETKEAVHYAEKPETFVGDIINAGIYVFSPDIFALIDAVSAEHTHGLAEDSRYLRLEQDLLQKICGDKHVYAFVTPDFWLQLKSAGTVIPCAEHLLFYLRKIHPEKLAVSGGGKTGPVIVGDVLIHPTAQVDSSAKLGPNVSIGANVIVGKGVRIINSTVLANTEIKPHACIISSVISLNCIIGAWSRLEGIPNFAEKDEDPLKTGITILGSGVNVGAESVVRSCIALPHKELAGSYHQQILL